MGICSITWGWLLPGGREWVSGWHRVKFCEMTSLRLKVGTGRGHRAVALDCQRLHSMMGKHLKPKQEVWIRVQKGSLRNHDCSNSSIRLCFGGAPAISCIRGSQNREEVTKDKRRPDEKRRERNTGQLLRGRVVIIMQELNYILKDLSEESSENERWIES